MREKKQKRTIPVLVIEPLKHPLPTLFVIIYFHVPILPKRKERLASARPPANAKRRRYWRFGTFRESMCRVSGRCGVCGRHDSESPCECFTKCLMLPPPPLLLSFTSVARRTLSAAESPNVILMNDIGNGCFEAGSGRRLRRFQSQGRYCPINTYNISAEI